MMKMINLEKLANVVGGSWTDELLIYYDFICSLYDKYPEAQNMKQLKKACTPVEKNMIHKLWQNHRNRYIFEKAGLVVGL